MSYPARAEGLVNRIIHIACWSYVLMIKVSTQTVCKSRMWHKIKVLSQSFSSPRPVAIPSLKRQFTQIFTHSWKKNSIPFLRVLVLCEMQITLSRIWTLVTAAIFNDDNHHIMTATLLIMKTVLILALMQKWEQKFAFIHMDWFLKYLYFD